MKGCAVSSQRNVARNRTGAIAVQALFLLSLVVVVVELLSEGPKEVSSIVLEKSNLR